jgi:hypothetical protein
MFENYLYLAALVIKMNCEEDVKTNRITPLFFLTLAKFFFLPMVAAFCILVPYI